MVLFHSKLVNYFQHTYNEHQKVTTNRMEKSRTNPQKKWEKGVHFQIIITTFGESVLSIIIKHYNYEQKAIWAFSKPICLLCN